MYLTYRRDHSGGGNGVAVDNYVNGESQPELAAAEVQLGQISLSLDTIAAILSPHPHFYVLNLHIVRPTCGV